MEIENNINPIKEAVAKLNQWINDNERVKVSPEKWWVIDFNGYRWIIYVTKIQDDKIYGYGFDYKKQMWTSETSFIYEHNRVADIETEVLPLLKAEAKKRGLIPGTKVGCLYDNSSQTISERDVSWVNSKTQFWAFSTGISNIMIMSDGKWAEPIKDKWEAKPAYPGATDHQAENIEGESIMVYPGELSLEQAQCIAEALNKKGL